MQQKSCKVLFFSPYFYPYISGITQYPYRLLCKHTLLCNTSCLTFQYDENLATEETINDRCIIYRMPFWLRISKGFISPISLFYFWREVIKTDIVIINLPSIEGVGLALIAKCKKKPIITFLHCEVALPFSLINSVINFVLNCGVFLQLLLADKIIVETKDYYERKWPYTLFWYKMHEVFPLVNTAIPDVSFKKKLTKLRNEHTYLIGFCGRISTEKGIEVLIKSASTLKNIILIFAGPTGKNVIGEESYYTKIRNLLEEKKIPHVFLGTLSEEQLSAFYSGIDLLVLPSINKTEAFGMVQVEAMLQGTPVIVSRLPGVKIPLQLTKMGVITTPNNAMEITTAIKHILKNKALYSNQYLINQAKNIFNPQKTYDSIYSIICQVIYRQ
ncbi:MAG: glycosyltransferase family 4 protein [bacterium]